MVNRFT